MLQCEDLACKFFKIFEIYFSLIFLLILILIIFSVFLYCKIKKYPKIFKQNLANNFAFGLKGDYAEFYSTMQSFYNPFLIFYSFFSQQERIFTILFDGSIIENSQQEKLYQINKDGSISFVGFNDSTYHREYNSLGQLVNISLLNGTLIEEYVYDGNGERVKSYNPIKNETIYTPFKEFMQIRNSEGIFNYTYIYEGETLVARINSDGSKYFYHPDHLGSTTLITDESGNVVEDNYYLPYGELVGESDEKRLYENKDYSSDIGEYDYNFRNYNPSYGIFLKADSMLPDVYDPQQLNRYMFERGNPYVYLDESGHWIIQAGVNFKGAFSGIIGSKGIGIVISNDPSQKGFQFGFYNSDTFGGAIPAKGSVEFEASFNQNDKGQFYSRNNNPNEGFINPEILDIMQGGDIRYVTM